MGLPLPVCKSGSCIRTGVEEENESKMQRIEIVRNIAQSNGERSHSSKRGNFAKDVIPVKRESGLQCLRTYDRQSWKIAYIINSYTSDFVHRT